jgi:hypothetical protein
MRLTALLATFASLGIFASVLDPSSWFESKLFKLPRDNGLDRVKFLLANFSPRVPSEVKEMLDMLKFPGFPYQKIYEKIIESGERQIELFDCLFSAADNDNLHEIFFSLSKLQKNLILAAKIFLEGVALDKDRPDVKSVVYHGNFFDPLFRFNFKSVYKKNDKLAMAMIRFAITEQMDRVTNLVWLDDFLKFAKRDHVLEIFQLILDHHEMTPEIFGGFMKRPLRVRGWKLIRRHLYPDPHLPREELLMRCALLMSDVQQPKVLGGCEGFEPQNNMDILREIAMKRKDRQSLSILFYWKLYHWKIGTESEMFEYMELGKLAPLTTVNFVRGALSNGNNLDDWPLEHLHSNSEQMSKRVPLETRLSRWMCSDALTFEDAGPIRLVDLYTQPEVISINLELTEPVFMEGDRSSIRAADIFILNARTALDAHRSDQQPQKAIPEKDRTIILLGALYALAEGQHLDFSNTEAEMQKDGNRWIWFQQQKFDHEDVTEKVLKYLDSAEIYNFIHRIPLEQCIRDEQVDELAEHFTTALV